MTSQERATEAAEHRWYYHRDGVAVRAGWVRAGEWEYPIASAKDWTVTVGWRPASIRAVWLVTGVSFGIAALAILSVSPGWAQVGVLAALTAYLVGATIAVSRSPRPIYLATRVDGEFVRVWTTNDVDALHAILRAMSRARQAGSTHDSFYTALSSPIHRFGWDRRSMLFALTATVGMTGWAAFRAVFPAPRPVRRVAELIAEFNHGDAVRDLALSPDGEVLVSVGDDHAVRLWDLAGRRPIGVLTGHTDEVRTVAFAADGVTVASAGFDHVIRFWDAKALQPIGAPLAGHTATVQSVAFAPDASTLVSGGDDMTVRRWDVANRRPAGTPLLGHTGAIQCVAFSPDGTMIASGGDDKAVRLWDAATGQPIGSPLTGHTAAVSGLAFAPGGTTLATVSHDETVRLWNTATGQPSGEPITVRDGFFTDVTFSPDGRTLATTNSNGAVWIFQTDSRRFVVGFRAHQASAYAVLFRPDGTVITGAYSGSIRWWRLLA